MPRAILLANIPRHRISANLFSKEDTSGLGAGGGVGRKEQKGKGTLSSSPKSAALSEAAAQPVLHLAHALGPESGR